MAVAGYVFVSYDKTLYPDLLVEFVDISSVRKVSNKKGPVLGDLERLQIQVPTVLKYWASNFSRLPEEEQHEFENNLNNMVTSCKGFAANFSDKRDSVVVLGPKESHRIAKIMIDVIFMNLKKTYAEGENAFVEPDNQQSIHVDSSLIYVFRDNNGFNLKKI
jgi:hypothetical protein